MFFVSFAAISSLESPRGQGKAALRILLYPTRCYPSKAVCSGTITVMSLKASNAQNLSALSALDTDIIILKKTSYKNIQDDVHDLMM